ncbi:MULTISPECIES: DUF6332 family protein [unclassified Streptomyces]|uniref:DUF6332 family protein n=1 Tax=unclassified Streptomyces TaxID=2593676 RepID=UPI0020341F82|nr:MULTISPECIES: DUF6332 family protein [unclassified Streptomyces]MCM2418060.1 DUF6332 family protein [Streptomyces sp. RKAG293]MCM2429775.1 DUF6332 family protein [Streptomyces sp. RKAG337]
MRRTRTQAERDATTVEMMYAAAAGTVFAAIAFALVVSPVLAGRVHGDARHSWVTAAVAVAVVTFCGTVAGVLQRHENRTSAARDVPGRGEPR